MDHRQQRKENTPGQPDGHGKPLDKCPLVIHWANLSRWLRMAALRWISKARRYVLIPSAPLERAGWAGSYLLGAILAPMMAVGASLLMGWGAPLTLAGMCLSGFLGALPLTLALRNPVSKSRHPSGQRRLLHHTAIPLTPPWKRSSRRKLVVVDRLIDQRARKSVKPRITPEKLMGSAGVLMMSAREESVRKIAPSPGRLLFMAVVQGILLATSTVTAYRFGALASVSESIPPSRQVGRTAAFITLTLALILWGIAITGRQAARPVKKLIFTGILILAILLIACLMPPLERIFGLRDVATYHWLGALCLAIGTLFPVRTSAALGLRPFRCPIEDR